MRTALAFLAATGALALAGCGGSGSSAPTTTARPTTTDAAPVTTTETTTAAAPQAIEITIEGGKPVSGITKATVKKGSPTVLVVHSDVADEVHLHGYDLHADVKAGGTARIRFQATIAGVFEAELESRGLQILELTVK